jgi:hypothetical protein
MAAKPGDKTVSGPFKGSKQNGGRPIYTVKTKQSDGTWKSSSVNKARADYEKKNGKLSKDTDVDHKDNNKTNDKKSNLKAVPHSKNVAKENKRRAR